MLHARRRSPGRESWRARRCRRGGRVRCPHLGRHGDNSANGDASHKSQGSKSHHGPPGGSTPPCGEALLDGAVGSSHLFPRVARRKSQFAHLCKPTISPHIRNLQSDLRNWRSDHSALFHSPRPRLVLQFSREAENAAREIHDQLSDERGLVPGRNKNSQAAQGGLEKDSRPLCAACKG